MKICATTLGETGGDTVTMTMNLGYLTGSAIFLSALVVLAVLQIMARKFHPWLYWATIVASTTAGTTMADGRSPARGIAMRADRCCCLARVGPPVLACGTGPEEAVSVATVTTPKAEAFYWATITFSQTLGTALGDWMADIRTLGYGGGALVFAAALAIVAALYFWTKPLACAAALGGVRPDAAAGRHRRRLPRQAGERTAAWRSAGRSRLAVIAVFIVACIPSIPQRAGPGAPANDVVTARPVLRPAPELGGAGDAAAIEDRKGLRLPPAHRRGHSESPPRPSYRAR